MRASEARPIDPNTVKPDFRIGLDHRTALCASKGAAFALKTSAFITLVVTILFGVSCGLIVGPSQQSGPGTITISIRPSSASVFLGTTEQFTASVTGTSNTAVTWSVNGVNGGNQSSGTISDSGLYSAPQTLPAQNPVTIIATSQADSSKSATASATLSPRVTITLSPAVVTLATNQTQQFTATITGSTNTAVSWSVNGASGGNSITGTISNSGLYVAPSAIPPGNSVSVTATSQADASQSAIAVVTFAGAGTTLSGGMLAVPPDQPLGNNQVSDPGFESGGTDWTVGPCFSIDKTVAHSGTSSLAFSPNSSCPYPDVTTTSVPRGAGSARSYTLQAWVMGTPGNDIQVKLSVHDATDRGDIVGETTVVNPGTTWTQLQKVDIDLLPIHDGDTLEVDVVVTGGTTGTVHFDDVQLIEQLPLPISAFLLYPNFRGYLWSDGPQNIRLRVDVPQPSGMSVQAVLQAEGGNSVSTVTQPASATQELDFDGTALALGSYLLQATLLNNSGQMVASFPAYRVTKVDPTFRASLVNFIDTDNFLVHKGQKVFVWGAYDRWSSHRCTICLFTNESSYLAIPGFNNLSTVGSYQDTDLNAEMNILPFASVNTTSTSDQLTPWLQAVDSVGVGHLQIVNNWVEGSPGRPLWASSMTDLELWQLAASAENGKPGALGYYAYDEPDPSAIPTVFLQYEVLRNENPGSVNFGTLADPARMFRWRDISDVASADPYPVGIQPGADEVHYGARLSPPIMRTSIWTNAIVQQVYSSRPVWMVLQDFQLNGQFPSYQQLKKQAYKAIINGATGLMWWGFVSEKGLEYEWYVVGNQQPYFDFQRIAGEVMGLQPFLISPPQPSLVQSVSDSHIEYLVKANSSQILIFASNFSENSLGSLTFTLAPSVTPNGTTVQVYSESRTVALSGSSFTDNFDAYDVHVYIVALK